MAPWEYAWVIYGAASETNDDTRLLFTHREEPLPTNRSVVEIVGGLGDEGWELVSVMAAPGQAAQLWFKRLLV